MRKVPKLRFKEFSDEWEEKNILEQCSMKARIGWQNLRKEEHLDKGEFYLITGTDFYLDKIKWDTAKFVEEERYLQDVNIILKEGDILITKDGSIGKLAFVENIGNKKATLNNGIFRIRIEKENHYSKYFYYTFLSKRFKNFLQQLTAGSTIVHLYQKDFEKYKIAYSSFKEQQKIANFLSSVDKKILLTEEKLESFREYKRGVMQKIFSQELRFKDSEGNDYPEWEEKKLGEIILLQRGSSPRPIIKYITNSKDGVNWIKIGDTNKDNKYITSTSEKITKEGAKKSREVKKGEIILSNSMSYGRPFILKIDGYIHDGWFVIRKYEENFNKEFLCQLLGSEIVQLQYKKLAAGGVVENISSELVNSVIIQLPILKEQEKIAEFLFSIDNKIESIEKELEGLKEFKKGLLQQMLV